MDKLNLEETVELYDFLRGECDVCEDYKRPKNIEFTLKGNKLYTEKSHLPKLTDEQAFLVIYALQEVYGLIPDTYEKCSSCGNLYDSDEEGKVHDEDNYCDLCYEDLEFEDETDN